MDFLQDAFTKIVTNKAFVQTAEARYGKMAPAATGKEVAAWTQKLVNISPADLDAFSKMVDSYVKR